MHIKTFILPTLAALSLAACAAATPSPAAPVSVRLPMGYIPNVQFAPYYVARDKGYFARENIAIEFDYKFETDGVKLVGAGELPFAVVSGEQVVLARANGIPVRYIAQWYREFPVGVISPQSAGVKSLSDLKGRKIGLPGFFGATYIGWRALLRANGMAESDFDQQDIGFTQVAALQQRKVDAVVGYVVNEPIVLAGNGVPVNVIEVGKAVDMVANGLLTSDKMIKEQPDLVRAMTRAVLRGVQDTIDNPDEALRISAKYVDGLKPDDPIQRNVLLATTAIMKPKPGETLGASSARAWENTQSALLNMGQIKQKLDVNQYYTNDYLP